MKKDTTSIIKYTDEGRVTIPREIRRLLKLQKGDEFEVTADSEALHLKVVKKRCSVCGKITDVISIQDIDICKDCLKTIKDGIADE